MGGRCGTHPRAGVACANAKPGSALPTCIKGFRGLGFWGWTETPTNPDLRCPPASRGTGTGAAPLGQPLGQALGQPQGQALGQATLYTGRLCKPLLSLGLGSGARGRQAGKAGSQPPLPSTWYPKHLNTISSSSTFVMWLASLAMRSALQATRSCTRLWSQHVKHSGSPRSPAC